jgi:hypothetical protein
MALTSVLLTCPFASPPNVALSKLMLPGFHLSISPTGARLLPLSDTEVPSDGISDGKAGSDTKGRDGPNPKLIYRDYIFITAM